MNIITRVFYAEFLQAALFATVDKQTETNQKGKHALVVDRVAIRHDKIKKQFAFRREIKYALKVFGRTTPNGAIQAKTQRRGKEITM